MSQAQTTYMPGRLGTAGPPSRRNSQVAKRRRVFMVVLGIFLLTVAVAANYGPLRSYVDARARLERATAGIAELTAQKNELQAELGRLGEADYLESLARQDLSYTRPGEELYIVTGGDDGAWASGESEGSGAAGGSGVQNGSAAQGQDQPGADGPGFVERVLAPILN